MDAARSTQRAVVPATWLQPDGRAVVAHRGNGSAALENTMEAFRYSIGAGATGIEWDAHRTLDGISVIHHDPDVHGVDIATTRYRDLPRLSNGSQLLTVDDLLEQTRGLTAHDAEIKSTKAGESLGHVSAQRLRHNDQLVGDVLSRFRAHGYAPNEFSIKSFDPRILQAVEMRDAEIATGLLIKSNNSPSGAAAVAYAHQVGVDFLGPKATFLDDEMLTAARRAGMPVMPWTVNDPAQAIELLSRPGVTGVVTDNPAGILDALQRGLAVVR